MSEPADTVECQLCPKFCRIAPGQSGDCRVRINDGGRLLAVVYGHPVSLHVDPMEKKPLHHFLPGTPIFSLATAGCNLHCLNCQNWEISQANPEETDSYQLSPEEIVALAREKQCASIAYTYTEPLVYYEYTLDSCEKARAAGLRNVLVTAGFANPEPLRRLYAQVDAANIDLKALSNDFYRQICSAELKPVLTALELAKECGVWLEVTNLVIPTLNDRPEMLRDLARWMAGHLGPDTPLHFSAFTPRYRLQNLPRTPVETLDLARQIARDEGLKYVYVGNVMGTEGSHTRCPRCDALLIERIGYQVRAHGFDSSGRCPDCQEPIAGVWQ
ncbi:MAG: AmmeMemoRadiSam system radical SAM enzyme [Planctomycetes bacterium]|nr:AmmeMemoRadiSam system radical SAM enzyme [Planctomycetota bacterium]